MRKIYYLIILLAFPGIFSCKQDWKVDKPFGPAKDVRAEYVQIDELLEINNIVRLEDYIVLQNRSEGVGEFFFVYSCPELEFLYSFARRGRGPSEYMMPSVIKNTPGNVLGFKDHATDKIVFYELSHDSAELKCSMPLKSPDNDRFFWEINLQEDSLFLVKHQGYKRGSTELWNLSSGLVDDIPNTFAKLPKKMGTDYYTIFDDYLISASKDRFAIGYLMIDRLEFGRVEDGKIVVETGIGATSVPNFHLYGHDTATEFSIDRNIVYYENLYAGNDFVYALYSGKRLDDTETKHSDLLEIYSWDGTPVSLLKLEVPIAYISVDESARTVYGINPELHEDKIIKYRY